MPNPPIPLDGSIHHELTLGLLYGFTMVLALSHPRGCSPRAWSLAVISGGYLALGLSQSAGWTRGEGHQMGGLWTSDSMLCRTWILAALVGWTVALEGLRERVKRFERRARQFTIADLIVTVTGFAFFIAALRHTSLIERGPVFWGGMVVIASVIPLAVVGWRVDRGAMPGIQRGLAAAGASVLVVGLALVDSGIAQPGKIGLAEAVTRYGCLIAAMMAPRLIEQSIAAADWAGVKRLLLSVVDQCSRPTRDADCLETQPDDHPDTSPMSRTDPRRTDTAATPQAQRNFNLLA